MNRWIAYIGLFLAGSVLRSGAASWIVWPGQSVQAAITNAAPGDNITIKEGAYIENVVIDRGIDIRGEAGKELTTSIQGTLTIQNVTMPVYLRGFKLGVSRTGDVSVSSCADVRLDYITGVTSSLAAVNSKLYLYRSCFSGNANINGGEPTLQKCTISGSMTVSNAETRLLGSTVSGNMTHGSYAKDCTIFQSTIGEQLCVTATNYWIAYSTIRYAQFLGGNGICEVVGCRFMGRNYSGNGVIISNTSPIILNCVVADYTFIDYVGDYSFRSRVDSPNGIIILSGNPSIINTIINNVRVAVDNSYTPTYTATDCGNAVFVKGGNPRLISCIINATVVADSPTRAGYAVYGGATVEIKYCNFNSSTYGVGGGCTPLYCINAPALFAGDYVLQAGSPCINSGDPDPIYNDIDNTRNDMGVWGGHAFDPGGMTNSKPVVIWSQASPLYIKRGAAIQLKARGAVSAD